MLNLSCPLPNSNSDLILLGHGSGGRLTHELIQNIFSKAFSNDYLSEAHDASVIKIGGARLAFTTDAFVVSPLFFPGGDIGKLAICGAVNDLAMCGARPIALSASFILEEGFSIETLKQIVETMRQQLKIVDLPLVTGDTKVVERGKADGLYITTSAIGAIDTPLSIAPRQIRPGDEIILSGDIGRHGIAVLSKREGLEFESSLESDCEQLWHQVRAMIAGGIEIHCLRDLTRGGLSTALVELAETSQLMVEVNEASIPICSEVRGASEILGLDPFYIANEGRMVAFVPEAQASSTLRILEAEGRSPVSIGKVFKPSARPGVVLKTASGGRRILDRLPGDQLPRIC